MRRMRCVRRPWCSWILHALWSIWHCWTVTSGLSSLHLHGGSANHWTPWHRGTGWLGRWRVMCVVQLMLQHRRRRRMITRHRAGWLVLRYHRRIRWMRVNPVRVHWTRRLRSLAQLLLKHGRAHRLLDHGTTRHRRTRRLSVSLLNLLMKLRARRVGGLGDHR